MMEYSNLSPEVVTGELVCFGFSEGKANSLRAGIWGLITSAKSMKSDISKERERGNQVPPNSYKDKEVLILYQEGLMC